MSLNDKLKRIDIYKSELDKKRPFEGHLLDQIKKYYKVNKNSKSYKTLHY